MEATLMDLGFTKNEAIIYISLLDLGLSTVTKIAEQSKIHRTNVYDAVERLVEKGLVTHIIKGKAKYFEATNPENLANVLKDKEIKLKNILPQLMIRKKMAAAVGEAHILEGLSAFSSYLDSLLNFRSPILVYGIPKQAPEVMKTFIPHFHKKRIQGKVLMRHIYNFNAKDRIQYLNTLPFTEAKYLLDSFESKASTMICGDQVSITIWENPLKTVQIINRDIAETYRKHFNVLWDAAKQP